jgi:signal transduction histidine kinase
LKGFYPDTIAARVGATIIMSLAAVAAISSVLIYLEGVSNGGTAEWLAQGRIVNAVQILSAPSKAERAAIAAALNTPAIGVVLRDTPVIAEGDETGFRTHNLRRLLLATIAGLREAPLIADRSALSATADPFAREAPAQPGDLLVQVALPQGQWALLNVSAANFRGSWQRVAVRLGIWFLIIGWLSVLAARRLTEPIDEFARAAEQLGTGQDVSPLPERGPRELRVATRAFNQMQERLRRFLEDRTRMLAAISHDLRTPLARLRLRAEFIEDDDQRAETRADLDAVSQMIRATLDFARDDAQHEQANLVDLGVLVADICDDIAELGGDVSLADASHISARCQPTAIRRAVANLVENAVKYGGGARVELVREANGVVIVVDDHGPGIPVDEQERVFAPFYRLEQSRNRDTGGVGLGLAVSRNIAREHGGDVKLSNRTPSGLRARLELPA